MWEAMVAEMRAERLDLHARATFASDGERISETRTQITKDTRTAAEAAAERSVTSFSVAASSGFVEVA